MIAAFAFLRRHWSIIAVLLALALFLRVDHLRASYKARWQAVSTEYAAFKVAIIDKTAEALAKEKEKAREADAIHEKEMADVRAATDRFIATRRMRVEKGGGDSASPAPSGAGVPESLSADSLVAVEDNDVRACAEAVKYAVDAHNWAISLENEQ